MDWLAYIPHPVVPILGALVAGAIVGAEREFRGQPAGLRTHILVCLASAFLMQMAVEQVNWMRDMSPELIRIDPVRMAHGVLTGVGFLCGGVIFRTGVTLHGLTTAASLWITSALGLLFGVELYGLAAGATVVTVLVLGALRVFATIVPQQAVAELTVSYPRASAPSSEELKAWMRERGVKTSAFGHSLTGRGELAGYFATVRAGSWARMDALARALREDPGVVEYEMMPRKP